MSGLSQKGMAWNGQMKGYQWWYPGAIQRMYVLSQGGWSVCFTNSFKQGFVKGIAAMAVCCETVMAIFTSQNTFSTLILEFWLYSQNDQQYSFPLMCP